MQLDYFFFYTEANIVCIVILAILLVHDRFHSTRQEKQIWFNWALVVHILYFISDIGWAAVISGHLPRIRSAGTEGRRARPECISPSRRG